jgi:hypothetical protein
MGPSAVSLDPERARAFVGRVHAKQKPGDLIAGHQDALRSRLGKHDGDTLNRDIRSIKLGAIGSSGIGTDDGGGGGDLPALVALRTSAFQFSSLALAASIAAFASRN